MPDKYTQQDLVFILDAAAFASEKHRKQKRKDVDATPYINHPLALARTLAATAAVIDPVIVAAALLHDTVEDTETSFEELEQRFGPRVAGIVAEVTDDKQLEKSDRKDAQVEEAAGKSREAKLVKLADKICNLRDILQSPPVGWSVSRKAEYFEWAARVVARMRGTNAALESEFDSLLEMGRQQFNQVQAS